jgi:Ca-activated chloride channel family protein
MADFHWLRPLWLLGILPLLLLIIYLWRQGQHRNPWQQQIAPHLLPHLLINQSSAKSHFWVIGLGMAGLIMLLALAGPTWQKRPQPSFKPNQALVILLDLSLSMNATDIEPTRLDRAKFKIKDIFQHENAKTEGSGLFALISYAGDAHVVTPLTDDHHTIEAMLPALNSLIMPIPGSRPDLAVQAGIELIKQAQLKQGQLLLITDDMSSANLSALEKILAGSKMSLSILGIGSAQGAPVPLPNGSFVKTNAGQPVIARLDNDKMRVFAEQLGARYHTLTADDDDLKVLLTRLPDINTTGTNSDQRFDDWQDNGVWLVLLLLPVVAGLFRRGWLWCVLLLPFAGLPQNSYAFEWQDLWLTPSQQAQRAYQQQDYAKAAERFEDPAYKGLASYRQGDYAKASQALAQTQDVTSLYNLGNALAKAQQYPQALQAYDQVLKQQPDNQDAAFNKAIVEKLAQQSQQPSQDQQQQDQKQQDQQQNGKDKKDGQKDQQSSKDGASSQDQPGEQNTASSPQPATSPEPNQQQPAPEPASTSSPSASPSPEIANTQSTGKPSAAPSVSPEPDPQSAQEMQQHEDNQALEQWLQQVPDDPSGLLRRKFLLQSQESQSQNPAPDTDQQGYW